MIYNSIWRFLALREYVDASHKLTGWGKVLVKVVAALKGKKELEEAALLAVELIRLGLLTGDITMFPSYNGAPIRGSGKSGPSTPRFNANNLQPKTRAQTCLFPAWPVWEACVISP